MYLIKKEKKYKRMKLELEMSYRGKFENKVLSVFKSGFWVF